MNSRRRAAPSLAVAALVIGAWSALIEPALAACSDAPGPGVYWRRCQQDGQSLAGIDLSTANLRDVSFGRASLEGSNLTGVDAQGARFVSANLAQVRLDGANLTRADFTNADLTNASLRGAQLHAASFYRTKLIGADLTDAKIDAADLYYADLSGATWTDGQTICAQGSIGRCQPGGGGNAPDPGTTTQ